MGTQWGPVREPGPIQCPAAWDIGLLSGLGRTTAAAAGRSELTGVPLPGSPCLCGPPILLRGVGVAAPCPEHPNEPMGAGPCLLGGQGPCQQASGRWGWRWHNRGGCWGCTGRGGGPAGSAQRAGGAGPVRLLLVTEWEQVSVPDVSGPVAPGV